VIQPFVRRPLRELPFLAGASDAASFSDIANPYGCGGPLCNVADAGRARALYRAFASHFAEWCDKENIASEFASLHPFLAEHQLSLVDGMLNPRHEKNVVFIDLSGSEADLLKGLNRGQRSNISKARRADVSVARVEPSAQNLSTFNDIYTATMTRRQAAARWFVSKDYFADCCRNLGPRRTSLFFATVADQVECAYLLMHDFGTAYYHFAGSRGAFPGHRANNLTMYQTAAWAQAAGYRRYYLGGGVTRDPNDSLLRFKSGFSDRSAPFYTYFCVRDRAVYDELCARKKAHERETAGAESSSDLLPLYRR